MRRTDNIDLGGGDPGEVLGRVFKGVDVTEPAVSPDILAAAMARADEMARLQRKERHIMLKFGARIAAVLVVIAGIVVGLGVALRGRGDGHRIAAFTLLSQASAAEANLFAGDRIVHLRNQIIVAPVADAAWAAARWLPLMSLEATGQPRVNQLVLPAAVNEGYTVEDDCWYDPATARFVRILTRDGKTIFASAYDGVRVYTLEASAGAQAKVVGRAITADFRPPQNPAQVLGIGAGLRSNIDQTDKSMVQDAGKTVLEDGTEGQVVKVAFPAPDGGPQKDGYCLFTIRLANNTLEQMAMYGGGQPVLTIRRGQAQGGQSPEVGWDLSGLPKQTAGAAPTSGPAVRADMVLPNISVQQMVQKADFATYVFATDPTWTGHGPIIDDVLDIVSPPKRMFMISYPAKDGRHLVLVQSPTYNAGFGQMVQQGGTLAYTSPAGIKVWDGGPRGPWLAKILLQSARYNIKDAPGQELTGYILQTPAGTFPALAVNGKLTDEELHALVDTLVPASSPNVAATEADLIASLREFAEFAGDNFPVELAAKPKTQEQMKPFAERHKRQLRDTQGEKAMDVYMAKFGPIFNQIARGFIFAQTLPPKADWHYAGAGVKLDTPETPIFWYRPAGAEKYRVIYADLSVREVPPEEVPTTQPTTQPATQSAK